ncbi:hypothetical protein [Dokdonella sp.]|uniref:hypothetical protein n=1 Tax=Dokdonella sp. TaxID=2291710 RepID=UPI003C3FEF80
MKSAPAIAFDYRPSRLLGLAIACMTVLAVVATVLNGLDLQWRLLLALIAASFGSFALFRHLQPRYLRIARGEGGWILVDGHGVDHPASLIGHVDRGGLLVLEFVDDTVARTRFILAADNCEGDLRRRLLLVLAAGEPRQQLVQTR